MRLHDDQHPLAAATAPLLAAARVISSNLAAIGRDEQTTLLVLAGLIGAGVGFAVSLFYRLIDFVQHWVLRGALESPLPDFLMLPLFVGAGLAVCRLLVQLGAKGSSGENIPDVMYRVSVKGGVVPLRPVLAKTAAAAVVIGTGGSVGAEGPVVVLGAGTPPSARASLEGSDRLRSAIDRTR